MEAPSQAVAGFREHPATDEEQNCDHHIKNIQHFASPEFSEDDGVAALAPPTTAPRLGRIPSCQSISIGSKQSNRPGIRKA